MFYVFDKTTAQLVYIINTQNSRAVACPEWQMLQ